MVSKRDKMDELFPDFGKIGKGFITLIVGAGIFAIVVSIIAH